MDEIYNASNFDRSSNLQKVTSKFFTSNRDLNTILYGIQYNSLYLVISFIFGSILDIVFPVFNSKKSNLIISVEIILQIIIMSIMIHYIKKLGNKIPFFLGNETNVDKRVGIDIVITITLICSQNNLLRKIQHISKKTIQFVNSKLTKPKKKLSNDKKKQIRNIVKNILSKNSNENNSFQQINEFNHAQSVSNQIQNANKFKQEVAQKSFNQSGSNAFVPMPNNTNQNVNNYGNALQSGGNFNNINDLLKPQNSMNIQPTNLNSGVLEGYRSNMTQKDFSNMF